MLLTNKRQVDMHIDVPDRKMCTFEVMMRACAPTVPPHYLRKKKVKMRAFKHKCTFLCLILFRVRQAANRVVLVCSTNLRIFSVTLRPPGPFRNDEQRKVVEMEGADSKPVKGRGRQCCICDKRRAALKRPKTLEQICRECFYEVFEEEQVIVQNQLFKPGERIAIGASGGKDSTVLAYVLSELNRRHNYGLYLFLLSVDEGITGYRDEGISSQKWCKACVLLEGLNRGLPKLGIGRSRGLNNDYTKGGKESNGTKSFESKQCGTLDF